MNPIPYGKHTITQEDINAVQEVLTSDFLTQGPKVNEFELKFASYIGAKYAVAVSNGTAALHLCAMALDVDSDTRVITTPITFAASANCIKYCGGEVYFADIDPESYLLDASKVEELLAKHPKGYFKGIIPVDFAGYPADMEHYRQLADKHGLWLIEDACHAPGACFQDSKGTMQYSGNGKYADLAIFSFHPVKHIATGEGGMITTNKKELYEKLLLLRTHGITRDPSLLNENHGGWYYEMQELGYNYRLTDIQAALGISQLKRAPENLQRRKEIAEKYSAAFRHIPITTPLIPNNKFHAFHLYVILTTKRLELYNYLRSKNIYTQVHYIPVHTMPYYKKLGWKKGDFHKAENYYSQCLSLPMYHGLSDEVQQYVINTVLDFFKT